MNIRRKVKQYKKNNEGAAIVEAAILTPFFMLLIIMIIEASLVFFAETMLDSATSTAARQIRTGQAKIASMTSEQFRNVIAQNAILMADNKISVNVKSFQDWQDFFDNKDKNPPDPDQIEEIFTPGEPLSVMLVKVAYDWPLILPDIGGLLSGAKNPFLTANGKRRIETTMIFRNEPFIE